MASTCSGISVSIPRVAKQSQEPKGKADDSSTRGGAFVHAAKYCREQGNRTTHTRHNAFTEGAHVKFSKLNHNYSTRATAKNK